MSIDDILWLLKNYIILAIKILIPSAIIFLAGYKIVYKKIIKGTKNISKKQFLLYAISLCYLVIVIGATFLSRMPSETYSDEMNLHLFSSYREAYHEINIALSRNVLFRNIILNILMFVPLGFLLPLYSDKLKKMYKVVLIGFLATLTIELTQHFNDYGVFEIDDILNNTLGSLIGYCVFMILCKLKNKEEWKKIIRYTIPIILTIGAFIGIFVGYKLQEFGNFEFQHNYTLNMKDANVKSEVAFSKERSIKDVYYIETLNKSQVREIAENIFKHVGKTIDETETMYFQNSITYWSEERNTNASETCHAEVNYIGGTYTCSNGSNIIIKDDNTIEFMKKVPNAEREDVEQALQKLGIEVPEYSDFSQNEREQYVFKVDMKIHNDKLIDGILACNYYIDKTVKHVNNNISIYSKVKEKEIISEEKAYQEILKGKFKSYIKVTDILIKDVELDYKLDSKGFYVPIYVFKADVNGAGREIYIKAIK